MNAVDSALSRLAAPGLVMTSSGRGATAIQTKPATTPSSADPATTASDATAGPATAPRARTGSGTGSPAELGYSIGTDMVGSSVRDQPDRRARRRPRRA